MHFSYFMGLKCAYHGNPFLYRQWNHIRILRYRQPVVSYRNPNIFHKY